MTRNEFRDFCASHHLSTEDAGRDWYDAGVKGAYICTVISSPEEFAAVKLLIESDDAYLASADRKDGQSWFEHFGYGQIHADDAHGVEREMADQYDKLLRSDDSVSHYSAEEIALRDKALTDNPALKGESEEEHIERVAEMQDHCWLTPLWVTEPGHWEGRNLIFSEAEKNTGLWSYRYDNWEMRVILVLKNTAEEEAE